MFRTVPLSIIRSYSLYTQQWYISYSFIDNFRAGSGWNCSSILNLLLLLESCLQTCMTSTIAECTVNNSWWWTEELSETCRVSFQNKFEKLVHLNGFIIRKFVTMHGHVNVKCVETTLWMECSWVTEQSRRNWNYDFIATQLHWKPLRSVETQLNEPERPDEWSLEGCYS
jgi:hypothetical protein